MTDVAKAFAAVRLRDATVRGISGLWGKRRRRNEALESSVRVAEATIVRTTVIEDDWVLCDAIDGTDPVVENIPAPLRPKKTAPLLPLRSMARPTVQETRAEGRTVTASGQDLDLRQFSGKQAVYECKTGETLCAGTDANTVGSYNRTRKDGDGFNCTTDLQDYRLSGVQITEEEFSRGSYATVILEYRGLKCAGKKLYPVQGSIEETMHRFKTECHLLAKLQHPNIVQFIGTHFQEGSRVPILVTEFLPITLARYLNEGVPIEEIKYSILCDVAQGLHYLHSYTPPIVHRDLSAMNVLLTFDMTAKISDLGLARILDLTPLQMSHMARVPGTSAYMPPEAISYSANPTRSYETTFDIFSYGILMIHVFCGEWPEPCEPVHVGPSSQTQFLPLSEAERRKRYLQDIGDTHPLMNLILRCISNYTQQRPKPADIIQQIKNRPSESQPVFTVKHKIHQHMSWSQGFLALCILFVCFAVICALANVKSTSSGSMHPC